MKHDQRLVKHYELEKELANRIRSCRPEDRKRVTSDAYKTLYEQIPWHISRNKSSAEIEFELDYNMSYLAPMVKPGHKILELGCGSGRTINRLGMSVAEAVGIDTTLAKSETRLHQNVTLIEDDVSAINLPGRTFDFIYSIHLIEHLHPDELPRHIQSIYDHLNPGGRTFILTPHAITGPHDISKYFDDVATGFHLKEYTYRELNSLLRRIGFTDIRAQMMVRRIFRQGIILFRIGLVHVDFPIFFEALLKAVPIHNARRFIGRIMRFSYIFIYATKK